MFQTRFCKEIDRCQPAHKRKIRFKNELCSVKEDLLLTFFKQYKRNVFNVYGLIKVLETQGEGCVPQIRENEHFVIF